MSPAGESAARFRFPAWTNQRRERIAHQRWKITEEERRNRGKWDPYRVAVEEMLARTSADRAPWTILPANSKLHARIEALKTSEREVRTKRTA